MFTESHCIPQQTALNRLTNGLLAHPDWSGFSCQTIPVTHNLLSEVEADVYAAHIQHVLESSSWLKVVDQCFLIRREVYIAAGGFREDYGHFAEWLLAAELHRLGFVIGFYPQRVIQHYYRGELEALLSFTLDFARGEMKYQAECATELTASFFP